MFGWGRKAKQDVREIAYFALMEYLTQFNVAHWEAPNALITELVDRPYDMFLKGHYSKAKTVYAINLYNQNCAMYIGLLARGDVPPAPIPMIDEALARHAVNPTELYVRDLTAQIDQQRKGARLPPTA